MQIQTVYQRTAPVQLQKIPIVPTYRTRIQARRQRGGNFRFCPPPPRFFSCSPRYFLGGRSWYFWAEKTLKLVISARKSLRISAKTFFFFFGEDLCPPDFNFAPSISRSWRRPCPYHYKKGVPYFLAKIEANRIVLPSLIFSIFWTKIPCARRTIRILNETFCNIKFSVKILAENFYTEFFS